MPKTPSLANLISLLAAAAVQLRQEVCVLSLRYPTLDPFDHAHLDVDSADWGGSKRTSRTRTSLECQWGAERATEGFHVAYCCVGGEQAGCWWVSWTDSLLYVDADCYLWVVDLGSFVDEKLPKFWEEYVNNRELPATTRKNALVAWLWVRTLFDRGFFDD